MAKIYADKTIVNTKKIANVYAYMSNNYDSCKSLIEDIKEKRMDKDAKKTVLSGQDLSITERFKYKSFIREHESTLKDIKKLGYEEFILGINSFIDIDNNYKDKEKVSASLNNLSNFHNRLLELGFDHVVLANTDTNTQFMLRFEENFITDGELINYEIVTPGFFSSIVGDDDQRLDVTLKDATFLITKELCSFRDKETFVKKAYILSNYPNKKKLEDETSTTIAETPNPLISQLSKSIQEEDYSILYESLYDERISFFQDLKRMKKEAKSLGIFNEITKDLDDKPLEELMDYDDLRLLKALMTKKRKLDLNSVKEFKIDKRNK